MRALIVTNMYPSREHPALGSFVHDQVQALRRIPEVELELFTFAPGSGSPAAYARPAAHLHRRFRHRRFDVVHAHYGLTAWPALAAPARFHAVTLHGTDLAHPRSRAITLAVLRWVDLVATVSEPLSSEIPRWATRRRPVVLPCGVDMDRFRPIPRGDARAALGLDSNRPHVLFPANPRRPEKRFDRARAVAGDAMLLTLVDIEPRDVPLWVNAVNAVLVPSEREGFGLGVLEALACDVPVLATPTGVAPVALAGVAGALCRPFDADVWRAALAPHLAAADPRIAGRAHAEPYCTDRMAREVVAAWQALSGVDG